MRFRLTALSGAALLVQGALALCACSDERSLGDSGSSTVSVHPEGILDPDSPDFHGRELARRDWSFATCAKCHGQDFAGGSAKTSCLTCHAQGPTACTVCHGPGGPTSNAHVVHRDVAKLACRECHVVPGSWDAEGHILRGGVEDPPPAEVTFGALASRTLDPVDRAGAPTYANGRCSNVYCHGGVLHDGGGTDPSPRWEDPAAPGSCVRCHGQPPPTHAQTACATCHPPGAPHLDGIVQVGRTSGCSGCHGDASSPAPPNDLSGNTLITAIGVGAHRKHLLVPTQLRGPIPCATCHQVPTAVDDPGHIDSPLPAEVNDVLGWDRSSRTCTTAACHGPSRPVWTAQGGVTCGSCHGVPPTRSPHLPNMTPLMCVSCHPQTIDAAGTIILTPGPDGLTSTHMNGTVDVR